MTDIKTKEDVTRMVHGFYDRVGEDELLGPVFNEIAQVDWKTHLPLMVEFWSTLLHGTASYKGQPFPRHAVLPLTPQHFQRWLYLFEENLSDNFKGPIADQALTQARQIARVFEFKFERIRMHRP